MMDASLTLWIIIAVVACVLIAGVAAMARRSSAGAPPSATPETPGNGMATPRPGLPGEPD